MGRGSSKGSGGSGGAAKTAAPKTTAPAAPPQPQQPWWKNGATTPAGLDYDSFTKMSQSQKLRVVHDIINDPNIKVPAYLDGSDTTKVIYALGMANKPSVVTDAQLSKMPGTAMFRTVNGNGIITGADITDQIRHGDYTRLSDTGGSVHGRALYFADNVGSSAGYASGSDSVMIRAKAKQTANIVTEKSLRAMVSNSSSKFSRNSDDNLALYALANGIDGWKSSVGYIMMVNRSALTISTKDKSVTWSTRKW